MSFGRKIRILQFPLAASKGGITRYVLNLWKNINKEIVQFDFMTFSFDLDFEEELLKTGCKVYHLSCYPEENELQFIKEFNEILKCGYDVIELHTSYWKSTIMEELARKQSGCKIIIHAHSIGISASLPPQEVKKAEEKHYQIRNMIDEKIADKFWACSREAADWLYGANIPNEKITIINNTIETCVFKYNETIRRKKREEWGLTNQYVIGHVGRLEREKNHKFILDIFAKLHKRVPQSILLLVGEGSYKEEIEKKLIELGIENSVILTGKKENVADYLQVMDIFVFPSLFEGFGMALLEAQCSGLMCIGSENIPKEVFLSEYAKQISLKEQDKWLQVLEETAKGYDRKSQNLLIKRYGYDTKTQIENLEKMYME